MKLGSEATSAATALRERGNGLAQALAANRSNLLYHLHGPMRRHLYLLGINQINRRACGHVMHETRCGIDIERGADDDEDVGLLHLGDGIRQARYGLAKPYYPRAEQTAVACTLAVGYLQMGLRQGANEMWIIGVARGSHLHEFSVEVDDVRGACALVEVVHVLRDDAHVVVLLHLSQDFVASVGAGRHQLLAQSVVKICHEVGVFLPTLGRGYFLYGILFPKATCIAKGAESAFGAHTCAREYN